MQLKRVKVNGAVSSLVAISPTEYYMATDLNEIYMLNINSFTLKLLKTSHRGTVQAIVFPKLVFKLLPNIYIQLSNYVLLWEFLFFL